MRTLHVVLPDIVDELNVAIPDYIPLRDDGKVWSVYLSARDISYAYRMGQRKRIYDHAESRWPREQPRLRRDTCLWVLV